jgi:hypothetical protein
LAALSALRGRRTASAARALAELLDRRGFEHAGEALIRWPPGVFPPGAPDVMSQSNRGTADAEAPLRQLATISNPMTDWEMEALPVLKAVYEVAKTKTTDWPYVSQREVNEVLGRDASDPTTERAIRDLGRTGYLIGDSGADQIVGPIDFELTEKSLQLVAGWPSPESSADAFLAALADRIEAAAPEERDRLKRLQDSAHDVGRGVLADLIAGAMRALGGSP